MDLLLSFLLEGCLLLGGCDSFLNSYRKTCERLAAEHDSDLSWFHHHSPSICGVTAISSEQTAMTNSKVTATVLNDSAND